LFLTFLTDYPYSVASTGVAHILEHSVLCGSRKYPTKEPFAHLLKGSLQNFLNAFTYPDRTCYPVASTNTKDFYNLVNVYLDAVLHPRAISNEQIFQQEGWHYELEDPTSPLSVKGVVYNEMKGVYSSPDALLGRAAQQGIFPDNTYGFDSGGSPEVITDLTYDKFKNFHRTFYHPSNSRVYFYGDDDVATRLQLADEYLCEFDALPTARVASVVEFQPKRATSPLPRVAVPFPVSAESVDRHMLTITWMLNDRHLELKDMLALSVLDHLLLGTPTSSLRKVLIESKLGEQVIGGGLSDELLQSTFSVGLKNVEADRSALVENLILATLQSLAVQGFDEDAINASMNTLEFRLRK
jgi:Zn-dependent M16 (insulinase) family peptidase